MIPLAAPLGGAAIHAPGARDGPFSGTLARALGVRSWQDEPIVTPPPDLDGLMQRVQRGDRGAFEPLYDGLVPVVLATVRRVLRDPAMSEEVTQEVFVELWRTAARFDRGRASVTTWAVTLARRRAVDRVRREQSRRDRAEALGAQRTDAVTQPDDDAVDALDAERVRRAVAELPDDQRVVIELAFLGGEAHGAIAERLGLPLGTVKGRVRGGLKRLRARLGPS